MAIGTICRFPIMEPCEVNRFFLTKVGDMISQKSQVWPQGHSRVVQPPVHAWWAYDGQHVCVVFRETISLLKDSSGKGRSHSRFLGERSGWGPFDTFRSAETLCPSETSCSTGHHMHLQHRRRLFHLTGCRRSTPFTERFHLRALKLGTLVCRIVLIAVLYVFFTPKI